MDLTDIFGDEICVSPQPRQADRQYVGWPGAHGIVGMNLGTRGKQIVIIGRLRAEDGDYEAARSALQLIIDEIEGYLSLDAADYTYFDDIYENVVFDKLQIVPDGRGKVYFWNGSECFCDFIMYARQLI